MQHCVHAEGCSSTRCLGTTFCAARRDGQGLFNTVSEFSPKPVPRVKFGSSCRQAWAERAGSAGPGWLTGLGWGQGPGRPGGELTGFFQRIDRIFPSSTSKRYLRGWGLGFRAEILGVDLGFRV